jgi:hypothetical protein
VSCHWRMNSERTFCVFYIKLSVENCVYI